LSNETLKARFLPALPSTAVRYDVAQTLTGPQQTQVKENIGLGSEAELGVGSITASYARLGSDQVERSPPASVLQVSNFFDAGGSQNNAHIVAFASPSGATATYEKAALQITAGTADPSPDPDTELAMVGLDCIGYIDGSNPTGLAWAANFVAQIDPGGVGDGFITGIELAIVNNGTDQATPGTIYDKLGITVIARTGNTTAGLWFKKLDGAFHRAIYAEPDVIVAGGTFIELANRFFVDKNGSIDTIGYFATETNPITLVNGLNSDIDIGPCAFCRLSGPTGAFSIGGIKDPTDGMRLTFYNSTAQQMTIVNEDASSTAAFRINTLTGGNVVLRSGRSAATFIYAATDTRWILVGTN